MNRHALYICIHILVRSFVSYSLIHNIIDLMWISFVYCTHNKIAGKKGCQAKM